jgi:hypothetical protein
VSLIGGGYIGHLLPRHIHGNQRIALDVSIDGGADGLLHTGLAAGTAWLLVHAISPSVAIRASNTAVCSRSRLGFLFTNEVTVGADAQKVDEHRNHVPDDHRLQGNQQAVDPEDLKTPMIAAIRGFIPALDRRLSMAIKSGTAANESLTA